MSANDNNSAHEEDHTGPVKTPKQLLLMVLYSFVVPIFAIIALVYYAVLISKQYCSYQKTAYPAVLNPFTKY